MPTTIVTSNLVGTGAQHTYSAVGDGLYIAAGAIVGTTTSSAAVAGLTFDNLQLHIAGTLISGTGLFFSGESVQVVIAAGGELSSLTSGSGSQILRIQGGGGTLVNYGTINAPHRPGFVADTDVSIYNYGAINASTPVFLGAFGDDNARLVNGGSISANDFDDFTQDTRFNNGVMAEGSNALISNLATGTISAVSSEGAGVRFEDLAGGSVLSNFGEITSLQDYGVNLGGINTGQALIRVSNWGTISGGDGAYQGSVNADYLLNRGLLNGLVDMGDGNDTLNNRGGEIIGDVVMGAGDDVFNTRKGQVDGDFFGGAGNDTVRGNAAEQEVFYGGTGVDTASFRQGPKVVIALDGSVVNAGAAAGDVYTGFENVIGSDNGDRIIGSSAANRLAGGSGVDTLSGGDGADVLIGGLGADVLSGGAGSDQFVFNTLAERGDKISDFGNGTGNNDVVHIDASSFGGGLGTGAVSAALFRARADNVAQDADDRFILRTTDKTLWFDADGNGTGAAVMVVNLQDTAVFNRLDILLI